MSEGGARGAADRLPVEAVRRPYELADYVDGVGVFCGRLAPARFPEHAHPEITIGINLENASSLATWQTATGRQLTRLVREGHTSVIPGDQPHGAAWREEAELLQIYLSPRFLCGTAGDLIERNDVEIIEDHTAEDQLIWQLGLALRDEFRGTWPRIGPARSQPPGRFYVESVASVLAVHLLRYYSAAEKPFVEPQGGLSERELGRAVDYVGDNLAKDLALAKIAGAVGLSPYHFARRFKESTGLSPHRYVVERRVEHARGLLSRGVPAAEVARRCGFYDQAHLNRHTKALLGVTPGQILREGKNVQKDRTTLQDQDS